MRAARKKLPRQSMIITPQNKTESAVAGQTHPAAKARNFDTAEILTKCQNFECQNFKIPENQDRMSSEKIHNVIVVRGSKEDSPSAPVMTGDDFITTNSFLSGLF